VHISARWCTAVVWRREWGGPRHWCISWKSTCLKGKGLFSLFLGFFGICVPIYLNGRNGVGYCSPRNVFDSCVKSWQYFRTDKILLEQSFYWPTVLSVVPLAHYVVCRRLSVVVCDVLYCGKTVRPSEKLSEGVNRKPLSKSSFFGSPPYFYFRFRRYGHCDGRFCLIFARTAQRSILDGTNWLSSSKPCAYCWTVWSELKPAVAKNVFGQ